MEVVRPRFGWEIAVDTGATYHFSGKRKALEMRRADEQSVSGSSSAHLL
ncbi:hypothetical protein CHELA20_40406 [Hyphomicrobiales bacterium]|nr:hypothetical protein CHELA20_40406 [Hyphomicrobiales bacterium]CAH1688509.1 hypothetical protein CHELA41_40255 [Hyphomicrobiales bacterium]